MVENETISDIAFNMTNTTSWNINDITDVKKTLNFLSDAACDLLISWGYDPSYVFFVLLLILAVFALIQHFFIKGSSGLGNALKYPAFAILVVIVLMALKII